MSSLSSSKRRQVLSGLLKLLFFIGFIFLSVPFLSSFTTEDISEKQANKSRWIISQAVATFVEGEVEAFSWSGGLVWVYTRTKADIERLTNTKISLRDKNSDKSDQPEKMKNNFRSSDERFFVFIPQENKRNCQVRLGDEDENFVFTEPCFSAQYDAAGRILKNSGHQEQQNLAVPNHVVNDGILKVAVWSPKIQKY